MPTRVLLEGPAIEPLLAQVREEYGAGVRIISADKVRTGGVGGFFAKQRYELSVEVPDEPPATAAGEPAEEPAMTLDELLDRAEARDGFADDTGAADRGPAHRLAEPAHRLPEPAHQLPEPVQRPAADAADLGDGSDADPDGWTYQTQLDALAGPAQPDAFAGPAQPDAFRGGATEPDGFRGATEPDGSEGRAEPGGFGDGLPARAGLVSTNGNAFAAVLAGLTGVGAPDTEPPSVGRHAAPSRTASTAVRPFRPPTVTAPAVNGAGSRRSGDAVTETRPVTTAARAITTATNSITTADGATITAQATDAVSVATATGTVGTGPVAAATDTVAAQATARAGDATTHPATGPEAEWIGYPPAGPPPGTDLVPSLAPPFPSAAPLAVSLLDLGMPGPIAARVSTGDHYDEILAALDDIPEAPAAPDRGGEVLVIAGELAPALAQARLVAEQLRLEASCVLLAGPSAAGTGIHPTRTVSGPVEAERKARRIHRADTAYVVVLDAPVTGLNEAWARDTCDALGATAVWAVVDATRKTADTRRYLRALGDVEAIAVYGAAETTDPASVLDLGLPIVAVDGRPADRHTWAALLCERLSRATAGDDRRRRRGRGR